jgi:hypothetical protein
VSSLREIRRIKHATRQHRRGVGIPRQSHDRRHFMLFATREPIFHQLRKAR